MLEIKTCLKDWNWTVPSKGQLKMSAIGKLVFNKGSDAMFTFHNLSGGWVVCVRYEPVFAYFVVYSKLLLTVGNDGLLYNKHNVNISTLLSM